MAQRDKKKDGSVMDGVRSSFVKVVQSAGRSLEQAELKFYELFKMPASEKLLAEFGATAMTRTSLFPGRIFLTPHFFCFHSHGATSESLSALGKNSKPTPVTVVIKWPQIGLVRVMLAKQKTTTEQLSAPRTSHLPSIHALTAADKQPGVRNQVLQLHTSDGKVHRFYRFTEFIKAMNLVEFLWRTELDKQSAAAAAASATASGQPPARASAAAAYNYDAHAAPSAPPAYEDLFPAEGELTAPSAPAVQTHTRSSSYGSSEAPPEYPAPPSAPAEMEKS